MNELTYEQASYILKKSRQTLYNMQADGRLPKPITVESVTEIIHNMANEATYMEGRLNSVLDEVAQSV